MSEELKQAKAAAKAAKAGAKALRPFYKKKRWWLAGAVVVIVAASAAGSGGTTTSNSNSDSTASPSDTSGSTGDTISTGFGSKDASADIVDFSCGSPDSIGFSYPSITVKNNSSKASDYIITVTFESADGSTKYDDSMAIINSLQPGQSTTEEGLPVSDIPAGAVCKVTEVSRTASN